MNKRLSFKKDKVPFYSLVKAFLFISFVSFLVFPKVKAVIPDPGDYPLTMDLHGFAWSDNAGWISFNSMEGGGGDYKVEILLQSEIIPGIFQGYAWADSVGWISFESSDLGGCPVLPCRAEIEAMAGGGIKEVSGWAKILETDVPGWQGWISLRDINYGVDYDTDSYQFGGYAWSDDIGWISFSGVETFSFGPTAAMSCKIDECEANCECNGNWVLYDNDDILEIENNSSDDIASSTWYLVGYGDLKRCPPNIPPKCNVYITSSIPAGNYALRLTVEDVGGLEDSVEHVVEVKKDASSNFMCSLSESGGWFDCNGFSVVEGEIVYFKDDSSLSIYSLSSDGGGAIIDRKWYFEDGSPTQNLNNVSMASTSFSFENPASGTVTLEIQDSVGRKDTIGYQLQASSSPPQWKEISPFDL